MPLALVCFLVVLGLILLLPARRLSTRLKDEWVALNRQDHAALQAFLLQNEELLKRGPEGLRVAELLLSSLAETAAGESGEIDEALLELIESQPELKAEWLPLLKRVELTLGYDFRLLVLYDTASAFGLKLDSQEIERRIKGLLSAETMRGVHPLSLIFQQAEGGSDPARLLVLRLLNERRMKLKDLPLSLAALRNDPALDPRLVRDPLHVRLRQRLVTVKMPRLPRLRLPDVSLRKAAPLAAVLVVILIVALLPREQGDAPSTESHGLKWHVQPETTTGFTIQVMASKDSSQARQEVSRLEAGGYWAYLLPPRPNSSWYRVRLGHFKRRAEADSAASGLKMNGIIKDSYVANYEP